MEKRKKKFDFKKLKKDVQGITLIALVVTIIVLLILAGIALNLTIGQNGIFSRAQTAANTWRNAETNEQLALGELGNWIGNYLNENGGIGTATPTLDGNTLTIGNAINSNKYGQKVTNYTVQAGEMTTDIWRLFYQDNNYTYLITDECVGSYIPKNYYEGVYNSGADVSTIGQNLNSMLLEYGNFFVTENTHINLLATAWLTDPDKWAEFKNGDAIFAIGSPTLELYAASFNASENTTETIVPEISEEWNEHDAPGLGYENNNASIQLGTYNHEIYYKNVSSSWWISSPGRHNTMLGVYVSGPYKTITFNWVYRESYSVRPIVCIPTSVFNSKYLASLVDE